MNRLAAALCSAIVLANFGCGGKSQPVAGMLYDAKAQIGIAEAAEAKTLANQEFADAEQMLAQAETVLDMGDEHQAYRLGMRAYLKARLAEASAILRRNEAQAIEITKELESKLRAADAALRQLEEAEDELKQLKATPQ
jgi:uncharacterized protein YPO0396